MNAIIQPEFTYLKQPPKRYTFEMPKVKKWVIDWCKGRTLNLFAGKVLLNTVLEYRVDIDPEVPAHWYGDAWEFLQYYEELLTFDHAKPFDTVVFDPPYNLRKAREKYGGKWIGSFTKIKNRITNILSMDGRVITFGYSTVGMSNSRGFTKKAILLICHSGDFNDSMAVVEDRFE